MIDLANNIGYSYYLSVYWNFAPMISLQYNTFKDHWVYRPAGSI